MPRDPYQDYLDKIFGSSPEQEDPYAVPAPTRRRRLPPATPPPDLKPEVEEQSNWQKYGAMGVRGIGGLFGFTPLTGALGGGLSEAAAQAIEQKDLTPELDYKKVAAETAIGAAGGGFAKLLGAAVRPIKAAVAGGLLGGAAPVIRHGFEQGDWDPANYPGEVLTNTAISGGVAGGLSALLGRIYKPAAAPQGETYHVDTTAVPGGAVLGPGGKPQMAQLVHDIHGTGMPPKPTIPVTEHTGPIAYSGMPSVTAAQQRMIDAERKTAEKLAAEADKARRIEEEMAAAGVEPQPPSFGTSLSAKQPDGSSLRMSQRFAAPEEAADEAGGPLGQLLSGQGPDAPMPTPAEMKALLQSSPEATLSNVDDALALAKHAGGEVIDTGHGFAIRFADDVPAVPAVEPPAVTTPEPPLPPVETPEIPASAAPIPEPPQSPLGQLLTPRKGARRGSKKTAEGFEASVAKLLGQVDEGVPPSLEPTFVPKTRYIGHGEGFDEGTTIPYFEYEIAPGKWTSTAGEDALTSKGLPVPPYEPPPAAAPVVSPTPDPVIPGAGGVALEEPTVSPATFFPGSRADVAGAHYRSLSKDEGPNPTLLAELLGVDPDMPQTAKRLAGAGLRGEAKRAGLPTGAAAKPVSETPIPPVVPEAPPAPTSWVDEEAAEIARLSALPPEERMAAFLNKSEGEAPSTPMDLPETPVTPETEVTPDWVQRELAEIEGLDPKAMDAGSAPAPATPPTQEQQFEELSQLLMSKGIAKTPEDVLAWMARAGLGKAETAPPPAPPAAIDHPPSGPRLVKKPDKGGTTIGSGLGGLQDILGVVGRNPEFTARLGLGAAGAAVGAATDPLDDPYLSALAGGAAGFSLPTAAKALANIGADPNVVNNALGGLNTPGGAREAAEKIGRILPQWQRFNYLMDAIGLPANAFAGPWGSGVFSTLEKGLAGDPRGWAAFREIIQPWNFAKEVPSSFQEAKTLIGRAEGHAMSDVPEAERWLQFPGTLLTTGDVAIRRILQRHGFSDDEARIMTMTAEPFTKSGKKGAHLGGFAWDVTFPFRRTPINIAEQGALRTPGLGFLMQGIGNARGTRAADPLKLQLWQQGIGTGVGVGSEQLGENLTPEQAKAYRRYVTNLAGPYSMQAGLGLAIGQAKHRGNPNPVRTGLRTLPDQLPLPSVDPIKDTWNFATDPMGSTPAPRGLYPKALLEQLTQVKNLFNPPPSAWAPVPRRRRR